jgi:hypothetical protein
VLWIALPAVLFTALLARRVRAPALLLMIVIPLAVFIGSLSLSAWPDYTEHARTSLDRLILGTCPFALWFVCEQLGPKRLIDCRTNNRRRHFAANRAPEPGIGP